ncbi:GntR family transcriptional regulator [Actinoplanes ianthinogenes]|uniref:GntR family transcriptional regulator n=1 Tax=Actinoplanes ianthinogenes TaxID=122358 RepID=A0ABN6CGT8_9ACTN|nr:GntR family transcriptional regulator [Actinoplanes ianthinogenes]BCJ43527.1 GntR family transcriptional regulator [Actinoplanes ianthinogenes]GGR19469.1 GntR family transcriptional regulator [Actinoplanes ianthinogenes]
MTAVPDDGRRSRQRQLAGDLRALILAGDIGPHQRLPSTAELTRRYAVTNMTVTRALRILKAEGLVTGHKGRSVTATARRPATVAAGLTSAEAQLLEVGETPAPAPVARAFGLDRDEPVVVRHQLRLLDGEPAELSWSYYPLPLARGTALAGPDPLPDGSLAALGYPVRHATDQVSVRPATVAEFIALRLPEDIPVLRQFRIGYTDGGRPVEVTVMIKAGQQFEIRYEVPAPG